jgi:hypothetical protein
VLETKDSDGKRDGSARHHPHEQWRQTYSTTVGVVHHPQLPNETPPLTPELIRPDSKFAYMEKYLIDFAMGRETELRSSKRKATKKRRTLTQRSMAIDKKFVNVICVIL